MTKNQMRYVSKGSHYIKTQIFSRIILTIKKLTIMHFSKNLRVMWADKQENSPCLPDLS